MTNKTKISPETEAINIEMLKHSERTEWQERLILAKAKACALRTLTLGGIIIIGIIAFRTDDMSEVLKIVSPIISGVLSFFAGRASRK